MLKRLHGTASVVAKKIVLRPRFSLSWSPFFTRELEQKFLSLIFRSALNAGLCGAYKMAGAVHIKTIC